MVPGGLFHVVGFDDAGLHVTNLREPPVAFPTFVTDRLKPAVKQVGIPGESQPLRSQPGAPWWYAGQLAA